MARPYASRAACERFAKLLRRFESMPPEQLVAIPPLHPTSTLLHVLVARFSHPDVGAPRAVPEVMIEGIAGRVDDTPGRIVVAAIGGWRDGPPGGLPGIRAEVEHEGCVLVVRLPLT